MIADDGHQPVRIAVGTHQRVDLERVVHDARPPADERRKAEGHGQHRQVHGMEDVGPAAANDREQPERHHEQEERLRPTPRCSAADVDAPDRDPGVILLDRTPTGAVPGHDPYVVAGLDQGLWPSAARGGRDRMTSRAGGRSAAGRPCQPLPFPNAAATRPATSARCPRMASSIVSTRSCRPGSMASVTLASSRSGVTSSSATASSSIPS